MTPYSTWKETLPPLGSISALKRAPSVLIRSTLVVPTVGLPCGMKAWISLSASSPLAFVAETL